MNIKHLLKHCCHPWPMAYNGEKIQQIFTGKQQNQRIYFDQGSKLLTPLREGDAVRMRWGNTWEPAKLVGESTSGEPRSFV